MIYILRKSFASSMIAQCTNYIKLADQGLVADACLGVPEKMEIPEIKSRGKKLPDDLFFAGPLMVVSEKLRGVFEQMDIPMEYVQVNLIHNRKIVDQCDFYYANILESIDCLDYENSVYSQTPTGVDDFENLVIDDSKALGHHLFLLGPIGWGHSPNPKAVKDILRCASEELKYRCHDAEITGIDFAEPNERNIYRNV